MTPAAVAGLAKLEGLDLIALTDHNSSLNCGAFLRAAEFYGIAALCGMELTTSEDIHVLCLFDTLAAAMTFHAYVQTQRTGAIPNNPAIFGEQLIVDETDAVTGIVDELLITASGIGFNEIAGIVEWYGGVAIPAHIDKSADSALAMLGEIPSEAGFHTFELYRNGEAAHTPAQAALLVPDSLELPRFLIDSDAHMPEDIGIAGSALVIPDADIAASGGIAPAMLHHLRNKR